MKLQALDPLLYPDEDILHAKNSFIDTFYELISESIQPPYAISVDGLWGTGKTTVMRKLYDKFKEEGYPVFWFNPWKYSQNENVILAFLQCLLAGPDHEESLRAMDTDGKTLQSLLQPVKITFRNVLRFLSNPTTIANVGVRYVSYGFTDFNDIKANFMRLIGKDPSSPLKNYKNIVQIIENEFVGLIDGISKANENRPVIIFLDDLDRCRPENAIYLLESLKTLFVVSPECKSIFICGIDTHVAKQFIGEYYHGLDETFSINYFRKIFNLTISMPYSPDIYELLLKHIKSLYGWDDPENKKTEALADMVCKRGLDTQIYSVRKYLNIINNFYTFQKFNSEYEFDLENDFVINLLVLKEAWQPLYEDLIKEALRERHSDMEELTKGLIERYKKEKRLIPGQNDFLSEHLGEKSPFVEEILSVWLADHPTLA